MLIKTILNKVEKYKSFVYTGARFEVVEGQEALVVDVRSRVLYLIDYTGVDLGARKRWW